MYIFVSGIFKIIIINFNKTIILFLRYLYLNLNNLINFILIQSIFLVLY